MTWKWRWKGDFLQNGTIPPILQSDYFSSSFCLHFVIPFLLLFQTQLWHYTYVWLLWCPHTSTLHIDSWGCRSLLPSLNSLPPTQLHHHPSSPLPHPLPSLHELWIGSFTVAIFSYFSATFRSTFQLLFDSLAAEWSKSDWKGEEKWDEKWLLWNHQNIKRTKRKPKCILPCWEQALAGLGTFKLPPNDLMIFLSMSSSPKQVAHWHVFKSLQLSSGFH